MNRCMARNTDKDPLHNRCRVMQHARWYRKIRSELAKVELDVLGLETGDLLLVLIVDIG